MFGLSKLNFLVPYMPAHDIFTNNSSPEEYSNDIMSEKPFLNILIDTSSEDFWSDLDENLENENPFREDSSTFMRKKLAVEDKRSQNWSRNAFFLLKSNSLIRSVPQNLEGTCWDFANSGEQITLPTLGCGKSDAIKRISAQTLVCLINKTFERDYLVIDARFSYEYDGGHIRGAVNINNEGDVFRTIKDRRILIFYCEFSSIRGPTLARRVRNWDRKGNEYPRLDFPEIYILEGGYRSFFEQFPQFCTPSSYIQMHDKRFKKECAYFHKKIKIKKN
ncbi:uncharacterized protein VICG_01182 [Vittaforma corneae ATCC 50505]|uniref:M-phase inducer phosphatase n=1 Tax=Vittaforma corneae (strain ATCC 50505) TaxID=993615 RepID=L2GMU8_VITCO|nr:uncharacterized protein VICG_01182 [Vittaforma corneae ATCC 50505]ELA41830.1 hypothetical protein VICG_01182 [Vittaforma corneae ATCC 50505]